MPYICLAKKEAEDVLSTTFKYHKWKDVRVNAASKEVGKMLEAENMMSIYLIFSAVIISAPFATLFF